MKNTPYEVGGFAFTNEKAMEKAEKELEGVHYVRNGIDRNDPQMVFRVYCQMIEQQIFETPVGYTFLYELQEYLRANPTIHKEEIPSIPVIQMEVPTPKSRVKTEQMEKPAATKTKTKTKIIHKTKEKNVDYKVWFRTSLSISVILLLIVVGMFAVTATSDNINIINYENALIEKYESWETKLNEKEDRLRERENAINAATTTQEVTP